MVDSLFSVFPICAFQGFPDSSVGKESACSVGDPCLFLGSGRSPGEGIGYPLPVFLGFPCGSAGKASTCNAGDLGLIPGLGRYPGEGIRLPTPAFWPGPKEWDTTESLSLSLLHALSTVFSKPPVPSFRFPHYKQVYYIQCTEAN